MTGPMGGLPGLMSEIWEIQTNYPGFALAFDSIVHVDNVSLASERLANTGSLMTLSKV